MDNFVSNPPCTFWFCHVDSNQKPIPGTMFSKHTNNLDPGLTQCNEVRLPTTQMQPVGAQVQCFFPNGLRYFYQKNTLTGALIPNSLIERKGKPERMCVGTSQYLEYKLFN
jgi:hypothetical protein